MSDIAISAQHVSKMYKLYDDPKDRLKESLHPFKKKYHKDFYAVNDVSLEVFKGETVGFIGRNGSGKSTLLKMITGVLTPSSGQIQVNGKISALLELGAGFNPELTGIENVYFNGALMGYSKEEMDVKKNEIIEFADIGDFVYQPVKTYSSGMFVRLAFAVAINVDPDILIVDEALAVGDAAFQMKCFDRIKELRNNGVTLLFVSHDPGAVKRLCDRTILLGDGKLLKEGKPDEIFDLYNAMLADKHLSNVVINSLDDGNVQTVSGSGEAQIGKVELLNSKSEVAEQFEVGEKIVIKINVEIYHKLENLVLGFLIKDRLGQSMFGTNTYHTQQVIDKVSAGQRIQFNIEIGLNLGVGDYSLALALHDKEHHLDKNYEWKDYAAVFKILNSAHEQFTGMSWIPVKMMIK